MGGRGATGTLIDRLTLSLSWPFIHTSATHTPACPPPVCTCGVFKCCRSWQQRISILIRTLQSSAALSACGTCSRSRTKLPWPRLHAAVRQHHLRRRTPTPPCNTCNTIATNTVACCTDAAGRLTDAACLCVRHLTRKQRPKTRTFWCS